MREVFAVRAHTADGSTVDLLLFELREMADKYKADLTPLPLGFDYLEIVSKTLIGAMVIELMGRVS